MLKNDTALKQVLQQDTFPAPMPWGLVAPNRCGRRPGRAGSHQPAGGVRASGRSASVRIRWTRRLADRRREKGPPQFTTRANKATCR